MLSQTITPINSLGLVSSNCRRLSLVAAVPPHRYRWPWIDNLWLSFKRRSASIGSPHLFNPNLYKNVNIFLFFIYGVVSTYFIEWIDMGVTNFSRTCTFLDYGSWTLKWWIKVVIQRIFDLFMLCFGLKMCFSNGKWWGW